MLKRISLIQQLGKERQDSHAVSKSKRWIIAQTIEKDDWLHQTDKSVGIRPTIL